MAKKGTALSKPVNIAAKTGKGSDELEELKEIMLLSSPEYTGNEVSAEAEF